MQHLQICDKEPTKGNCESERLEYYIWNFTRLLYIFRTLTQLHLLYTKQLFPATCYCAAAFYTFLLAINFNIETTVMVTSLLLCLHYAVIALILNPITVGTVVLTSRPRHITPGITQEITD